MRQELGHARTSLRALAISSLVLTIFVGVARGQTTPLSVTTTGHQTDELSESPARLAMAETDTLGRFDPTRSLIRVVSSMAIVFGVFFVGVWIVRNMGFGASAGNPAESLRVLRRIKVSGKNHVSAIQFGTRLLLVSDSPGGLQTLAEITDHDECRALLTQLGVAPAATSSRVRPTAQRAAAHYTPTEQELREWMQRDRIPARNAT